MLKAFKLYIKKYQLFQPHQKLLVAVSGGVDSMVLCDLLQRCGYQFAIAHCNFHLRGEDSDKDEAFVDAYAQRLNVPFFIEHFDTLAFAQKNKWGIQEAARILRYDFFNAILKGRNIDFLLTAHHANDNIETVLHHFMRGAGWQGMSGITNRDEELIRPLLWATKKEILDYAHKNKITYREDASNASDKYTRNALRLNVIPEMEKINPHFVTSAQKTIEYLRDSFALFSSFIEALKMDYVTMLSEDSIRINTSFLPHFPSPHIILYEFLKRFDFNATQVENITDACFENKTESKIFFSSVFEAEIKNQFITVRKKQIESEQEISIVIHDFEKKIIFQNHELHFENCAREKFESEIQSGTKNIFLDADKLVFPLTLRNWRDGDYFFPLGMEGKKKKVSAYLKSLKLSQFEKEAQYILTNTEGAIIAVLGLRSDENFSVNESTQKILQLHYTK